MTSKARKRLEEFKVEGAEAYDVAVMVLDYSLHAPDAQHEKTVAIHTFLQRWRAHIEKQAAPVHVGLARKLGHNLRHLIGELSAVAGQLEKADTVPPPPLEDTSDKP